MQLPTAALYAIIFLAMYTEENFALGLSRGPGQAHINTTATINIAGAAPPVGIIAATKSIDNATTFPSRQQKIKRLKLRLARTG